MLLSRRNLLLGSGLAALGAGALSACSTSAGGSGGGGSSSGLGLWYWNGGLSDKVVEAAKTQFPKDDIKPNKVGGDFKQKLQTTLTGGSFIPQITGVKGEDMPYFRSVADKFTDLNQFGVKDIASTQLAWKWSEAQTQDGKQLGFPIDIGPTAMFYRSDILAQAGLPTDPAAVAAATSTWDDFYAFGQELHGKVPASFPVPQLANVFQIIVGQLSQRFVSEDNTFTGDSDEMKQAWDTTVKAQTLGLNANVAQSLEASTASGVVAMDLGAAWHALDIKLAAPDTSGKWMVANNPVKPTNSVARSSRSRRRPRTSRPPSTSSSGSSAPTTRARPSPTRASSPPTRPPGSWPHSPAATSSSAGRRPSTSSARRARRSPPSTCRRPTRPSRLPT
jgi:cellobiose transport system substrate-binding protein